MELVAESMFEFWAFRIGYGVCKIEYVKSKNARPTNFRRPCTDLVLVACKIRRF